MSAGKGDSPRPVDPVKFRENYDRIFNKNPVIVCPNCRRPRSMENNFKLCQKCRK